MKKRIKITGRARAKYLFLEKRILFQEEANTQKNGLKRIPCKFTLTTARVRKAVGISLCPVYTKRKIVIVRAYFGWFKRKRVNLRNTWFCLLLLVFVRFFVSMKKYAFFCPHFYIHIRNNPTATYRTTVYRKKFL